MLTVAGIEELVRALEALRNRRGCNHASRTQPERLDAPARERTRRRHRGNRWRLGRLRRGDRPYGYTIIDMAQQLDIDPQWIYRGIANGRIEISKDSRYGCYLFPRTKSAVARMKQLKCGKVREVSFREKHCDA